MNHNEKQRIEGKPHTASNRFDLGLCICGTKCQHELHRSIHISVYSLFDGCNYFDPCISLFGRSKEEKRHIYRSKQATKENYAETAIKEYFEDYKSELVKVFELDAEGNTTFKLADENGYKCVMGSGWENSGVTAIEYNYTAKLGGIELSYAQIIAFYNNYFYIVTFTTRPDLYDMHSEDVAQIVKYIKVK